MCIVITEIDLAEKLQLLKFLACCGIEPHTRSGMGGDDVIFAISGGVKMVAGSENVTLVDDAALNFITMDRSTFLDIKIQ